MFKLKYLLVVICGLVSSQAYAGANSKLADQEKLHIEFANDVVGSLKLRAKKAEVDLSKLMVKKAEVDPSKLMAKKAEVDPPKLMAKKAEVDPSKLMAKKAEVDPS
ncbi:MAG: hypothetical protein ABJL34_02175, partial [Kangiellaceae bacterium]